MLLFRVVVGSEGNIIKKSSTQGSNCPIERECHAICSKKIYYMMCNSGDESIVLSRCGLHSWSDTGGEIRAYAIFVQ